MHGSHSMTMLPLERVPSGPGGPLERKWDQLLAPTLNQVTPFGGLNEARWHELLGQARSDELKGKLQGLNLKAAAVLSSLEGMNGNPPTLESLLEFLVDIQGHVLPKLFESLFSAVKKQTLK